MYRSVNISHRLPNANPQAYWDYTNNVKAWASWLYLNDGDDGTFGQGSNVTWSDGHSKYKVTSSFTWYEIGNTDVDPSVAMMSRISVCRNAVARDV